MEQETGRLFEVDIHSLSIDRYEGLAAPTLLSDLRSEAARLAGELDGRVFWHVNSTAEGGGVAEMLPSLLGYCRHFGIDSRWLVIGGNPAFFRVTKRLHHGLHGQPGDGTPLDEEARRIGRANRAEALLNDEMFQEAFEAVESVYEAAWRTSDAYDYEQRERAYVAVKLLDDLKNLLLGYVRDGEIAQKQLERSMRP